jgi:hypothetical protein
MALWRLIPDPDRLDHPFWARSLNKQPVTVIASDEKDARKKAMAMENNDNAVLEVPGADTLYSPWKDSVLVHAEVIQLDLGPY